MRKIAHAGRFVQLVKRLTHLTEPWLPRPEQYPSAYYDLKRSAKAVRAGRHRTLVGGLWDEVGQLQFDYVKARGLTPDMYVLDLGCGCLRGGLHFVRHLLRGHYYGIDISQDLLDAGYDVELGQLGLQTKLPRGNLVCDGEFHLERLGVTFDVAVALSLFTHLPAAQVRLCLTRLADVVRVGGIAYATIFHAPDDVDWRRPLAHSPGGIVTRPNRDPYHYRERDILTCAAGLPWSVALDADWGHPRGQAMLIMERLSERA